MQREARIENFDHIGNQPQLKAPMFANTRKLKKVYFKSESQNRVDLRHTYEDLEELFLTLKDRL